MPAKDPNPVLQCPECGSRVFEIRGPVTDEAPIHCAACGAPCGAVPDVMAQIEARVREREEDRKRRRLN